MKRAHLRVVATMLHVGAVNYFLKGLSAYTKPEVWRTRPAATLRLLMYLLSACGVAWIFATDTPTLWIVLPLAAMVALVAEEIHRHPVRAFYRAFMEFEAEAHPHTSQLVMRRWRMVLWALTGKPPVRLMSLLTVPSPGRLDSYVGVEEMWSHLWQREQRYHILRNDSHFKYATNALLGCFGGLLVVSLMFALAQAALTLSAAKTDHLLQARVTLVVILTIGALIALCWARTRRNELDSKR